MTASNDCINLSLINGKVLCFSPSDYKYLRSKHHFVGKFIGIPICFQRNSLWNGLPVLFSEYEAKLMLEKGLITIKNKKGLEKVPNDLTKKVFADHQEKVASFDLKSFFNR